MCVLLRKNGSNFTICFSVCAVQTWQTWRIAGVLVALHNLKLIKPCLLGTGANAPAPEHISLKLYSLLCSVLSDSTQFLVHSFSVLPVFSLVALLLRLNITNGRAHYSLASDWQTRTKSKLN